jgi:clumping factor A
MRSSGHSVPTVFRLTKRCQRMTRSIGSARVLPGTHRVGTVCALLLGLVSVAQAVPQPRVLVNQRGGLVLIGNTLGCECSQLSEALLDGQALTVPALLGGTEECALAYPGDTARAAAEQGAADEAPDLYWQVLPPEAKATAGLSSEEARSEAVLELPVGAGVTHARLYWAGYLRREDPTLAAEPDETVSFFVPDGSSQYEKTVTASQVWSVPRCGTSCTAHTAASEAADWYQAAADVTGILQSHGPGRYGVSGVRSFEGMVGQDENAFSGWWLVVFYQRAEDPVCHLALFDGLDRIEPTATAPSSTTARVTGFVRAPEGELEARLGVVGYEGDVRAGGDWVAWNGSMLSSELNPAYNFFNSTRTAAGVRDTRSGDLPWLDGGPGSLAGLDLDQVMVSVPAGATTAEFTASSKYDPFLLGGFVTMIPTQAPVLGVRQKTVRPLEGDQFLPGGLIEYRILLENTGNDAAVGLSLRDTLPDELAYVEGSLQVASGPGAGSLTDLPGDDAGELQGSTVLVRLGQGASATSGGRLEAGERVEVTFHARILPELPGCEVGEVCHIGNQALVVLSGASGAAEVQVPTDADASHPGDSRTWFTVDGCVSDEDCAADGAADCQLTSRLCTCQPTSGACADTDGDGVSDEREGQLGTDPNDQDSDDDGLPDGAEPSAGEDLDHDGLVNARDPDSDNDGLFDGTEMGRGCEGSGTDATAGVCRPDADGGATTTSPVESDTDGGNASDGSEDWNLDGRVDPGESDPSQPEDDAQVVDSDGDGLGDLLEGTFGSDPADADSDDDGVPDGAEPNPGVDLDRDGRPNLLDPDSDGDLLFDGTEMGYLCDSSAIDQSQGHCIPDGDAGLTTTSPVLLDSDGDGMSDAYLDRDRDGRLDGVDVDLAASIRGGGCGCQFVRGSRLPHPAWIGGWLLGMVLVMQRRRRSKRDLAGPAPNGVDPWSLGGHRAQIDLSGSLQQRNPVSIPR